MKIKKRVFDAIGRNFGELGDLEKYAKEVDKEVWRCVERFDKEKSNIKDGYFWEFESRFSVKSLVINALSGREKNKTFIIGGKEGKHYFISARRQDKKISLHELLKKLVLGFKDVEAGGHAAAAGGYMRIQDAGKFKKRVLEL